MKNYDNLQQIEILEKVSPKRSVLKEHHAKTGFVIILNHGLF